MTRGPSLASLWFALALLALGAACSNGTSAPPDNQEIPPPPPPLPRPIADKLARCTQEFGDPTASLYVLPFPSGQSFRVNQTYCPPNPAWGHNGWLAYDFAMPIGFQVIASRAGTVVYMVEHWPDSDRVCGHENGVWIRHADGTVMNYVHFTTNGALVAVGDQVTQGQLIGLSGDSGCSSGPHLHVTLYYNGTSFNKENTIPLTYNNASGPLDIRHGLVQDQVYQAQ